jgi:hypothetical protein
MITTEGMKMKQIGVRLEEELLTKVKKHAKDNKISLQDLISTALDAYISNGVNEKITNDNNYVTKEQVEKMIQDALVPHAKQEITPIIKDKKEVTPIPTDDLFHILPKTHKVGKPEKMMKQYWEGTLSWMIPEGCCAHYDKNGNQIPFRMTDEKGKVFEPDLDELNEMTKYYGKPIELE